MVVVIEGNKKRCVMKIDLYEDGIGSVELVQHMGEDLTVVNSARVSFGKEGIKTNIPPKQEKS